MNCRTLQAFTIFAFVFVAGSRGQTCTHGRQLNNFFPFLGLATATEQGGLGIGTVTLYLSDAARNAIFLTTDTLEAGAGKWTACPGAFVPNFAVNTTDQRPPLSQSNVLNSTILINFVDGWPSSSGGTVEPAHWSPADNSITLYGKCPPDGTYGMPCFGNQPGGAIRWDLPGFAAAVITHEIGHALGLEDEAPSQSCTNGVMQSPLDAALGMSQDYCRLANQINNLNAPCQGEAPGDGEINPCESDAKNPRGGAGGPGGIGNGGDSAFCDAYEWLCGGGNPWSGSGIECSWGCARWSDNFGGSGSSCSWACYAAAVLAPTAESTSAVEGLAPFLAVTSPVRDATIQGVVPLAGFAMDFNGVASVSFGIDGQPVAVSNYHGGLSSPEACSLPLGIEHSACKPNSGFSAMLDTTLLANGPHVLSAVSYDLTGWTTSIEVPITVNNPPPCEQVAPTVSITNPTGGSIVTGTISVTANASDNVGVVKVELYVDNNLAGIDTAAPHSFNWNTTGLAAGNHTLKAKAIDACNNSTISAPVTVTVQQETTAPQATWTAPASGAIIRGTVSLQAQASDDIGVTKVEFYVNGALQGTDTTAPYAINWATTTVADGSYSLYAKAFDAAAKNGTSATVTVKVDNTAPRSYIDGPAPSATVSGTAVQLIGWATDPSRITSLAFKLDSQSLVLNSPYTYGLYRQDVCNAYPGDPGCPYVGWQAFFDSTRFTGGLHTLEVIATDGAGLTVTAQRTFTINNDGAAPTVSITAPGNGSTVKGLVAVQASASDNIGVTRVEFLVNNVVEASDTTAPYTFSWNTAMASEGGASVVAKAYDAVGNSGTSSISVTVDNLQPKIRIMADDGSTVSAGMSSAFPSTPASATVSRLYTIYNDGNETLQIQNATNLVSGYGFSLIVTPPSQIAPSSSGIFRVRLLSSTPGTYTGTVSIQNSDPAKTPFTFYVTGTVTPPPAPKIRIVSENGVTLSQGMSYVFPSTTASMPVSRLFTIYNDGTAALDIQNPGSLVSGYGFSLIVTPPSQIAPGSSGVFRVRLLSSTPGTYNGTVSIQNSDATKNPFTFYVTGTVTPTSVPKVRIVGCNGSTVTNGSLYTFSNTTKSTPISCLFTIYNDGDATLTISNPSTLVSGAGWSLIVEPPSSIAMGASGVFRVRLLSATAGTYTGSVTIQNNSATNPFSFSLRGTVN